MARRAGFDEDPLRVLVAGDFRAGKAGKPLRVDVDNFDDVMARMAARLELQVAGEKVELEFRSLDDFHPDFLYRRLAPLRELHAKVLNSAGSDAETIARLLGGRPAAAPASPPQSFVQGLIRDAVAPHIVPAAPAHQALYAQAADAAVAEEMRRLLHEPGFQALEALWRGVHRLVFGLEGDELQLFIVQADRAELAAVVGGEPWSLIVADYAFGAEDVESLAALGTLGAPFLADAKSDIVEAPGWSALRKSEAARSIGLAAPRVLARLPYGKSSDPIESFAFEEGRTYLWGSAALACALLKARGELELDDLPAHVYEDEGEKRLQPCAESSLSERAAQALLEAGIMPFLSPKNRNAVRLMRLQSIAA